MKIETFLLERNQSEYENEVEINLTESGVHPLTVRDLLAGDDLEAFLDLPISYGYTEGTPELRNAIASWYPDATAENVLVTTGTSEANFITAWTLLDRGDELVLMVPNFMQLYGAPRAMGATVTPLPLRPENGWRLDFDEVDRVLAANPKLVSIVNPHNPSGKVMPPEDMIRLVTAVERTDAMLLVDEIYRGAELGERPETPTFWGMSPRVIVTSSTSKSIAHAGLRLGWIVGPAEFIHEAMRRQDYTTIGTSPLSQFIGSRLLASEPRAAILGRARKILNANLAQFETWVGAKDRGIEFIRPEAGGMVFFRYPQTINSTELSRRLRNDESVFIVAGDWFGMDSHMRIGIGGEQDRIAEGLARFGRFLDKLNG